ncbi:type I restriction enzyme, S subunit [Enterococcus sp. DIV2371]|nr:restriction endonuclease subunit S [Enterococcus sp. DIV1298c]
MGDLGSVAMNKRIFKDQTSENGEVPFFKIGTFGSYPDAFISRELFEEYKSKYPYPEVGDILISASGSIGRTVVYQGEDEYFQDSNIVWLKHNGHLDNKFLQQFYSIVKWQGLEGSTIKRLYNKNIIDTNIKVPTLDEQNKLGVFFEQLDYTLALHQRKLELLKRLKQGFLQVLFAKEATVPRVRFAGFTEEWEQRKFNDCFNFPVSTNSLSRAMLNYDSGEIMNIHYGDILIKYSTILNVKKAEIPYITGGELEKYISNLLENQDLIFADAAEDESVGKAVEVSGITNENLVSGLHTIVARAKGEKVPFFWGYYINSDIYHRQLLRLMQGSKVSAISKGNLQKTNVSFPNRMKEQQKIGTFFNHLDNTITLHQNKISQLKNLKKAFLQKMFI